MARRLLATASWAVPRAVLELLEAGSTYLKADETCTRPMARSTLNTTRKHTQRSLTTILTAEVPQAVAEDLRDVEGPGAVAVHLQEAEAVHHRGVPMDVPCQTDPVAHHLLAVEAAALLGAVVHVGAVVLRPAVAVLVALHRLEAAILATVETRVTLAIRDPAVHAIPAIPAIPATHVIRVLRAVDLTADLTIAEDLVDQPTVRLDQALLQDGVQTK